MFLAFYSVSVKILILQYHAQFHNKVALIGCLIRCQVLVLLVDFRNIQTDILAKGKITIPYTQPKSQQWFIPDSTANMGYPKSMQYTVCVGVGGGVHGWFSPEKTCGMLFCSITALSFTIGCNNLITTTPQQIIQGTRGDDLQWRRILTRFHSPLFTRGRHSQSLDTGGGAW